MADDLKDKAGEDSADPNQAIDALREQSADRQADAAPKPASHRAAAEAAEEAFFDAPDEGGDDDLDPELMALPPPRRRRHPVIALAVIVGSIALMIYVRHDFLYFFQPRQPVDLGEVAQSAGKLVPNTFVKVRGAPDRKRAARLSGRFAGYDTVFRLQQAQNLVFVQRSHRQRTSYREVPYEHVGRVVRLTDVAYVKILLDFFGKHVSVSHEISPAQVIAAKQSRAGFVIDSFGRKKSMSPTMQVWVNVVYPGEWRVQFMRRYFTSKEQAAAQLDALKIPYIAEVEPSQVMWRFAVLAGPEQLKQLRKAFVTPTMSSGVVPRQLSYLVRWEQIRTDGKQLVLEIKPDKSDPQRLVREFSSQGGYALTLHAEQKPRLSADAIRHISVAGAFAVPQQAVLILSGENPKDYWFYPLLYLLLAIFCVVNTLALISRFRR